MAKRPSKENPRIKLEILTGDIRVVAERNYDLACYLIEEWGGETVYVPQRDIAIEHSHFVKEMTQVWGTEGLHILAQCMGGDVLYIPSLEKMDRDEEVSDIIALHKAGVGIGALARMFRKARRTIRGIVIAKKKPEPVVDDRQLNLF